MSSDDDMVLWTMEELQEHKDAFKREDEERRAANRSRLETLDAIIAQVQKLKASEKQDQSEQVKQGEAEVQEETTTGSPLRGASDPEIRKPPVTSSKITQSPAPTVLQRLLNLLRRCKPRTAGRDQQYTRQ